MEIKDILKQLLIAQGVEVAALARDTGIARQAIADILNGKTMRPQNKTLKRLAEYFNVAPSHLLAIDDTDPLTDIRAEVAELKRRLNGADLALNKVSLTDSQRQALRDKYIHNEVVSVAGRVNGLAPEELETLDRFLWWWDKTIRKTS